MSRVHALILAAAIVVAPAFAVAIVVAPAFAVGQQVEEPFDKSRPVTIYVDNRGPCFGGRIGQARENASRWTANSEARRLRKLGYTVRIITLSAGMDRTAADINARIFTSIC